MSTNNIRIRLKLIRSSTDLGLNCEGCNVLSTDLGLTCGFSLVNQAIVEPILITAEAKSRRYVKYAVVKKLKLATSKSEVRDRIMEK